MALIEKRKRERLWWMAEGEEDLADNSKLEEAYDPARLKPGYDGRNGPDVKQMYAKKGEARFDDMGAAQGEKTKKGDSDKVSLTVKENKKRVKEIEDPSEDMDHLNDDGMDDEDDVPPELDEPMDDDEDFDDGADEDNAEDIADDVHIEIDGQRFRLVPEPEEGEGENEDDDNFDDEGMGPEGTEPGVEGSDVGAEDKDVELPESKNKVKGAIREAKAQKEKAQYIRKLLKMKSFAESQLKELFTGDYVMDKRGLSGLDFKPVRGDNDYAVIARAATGDQYTATDSKSPYEPGSDAKGQTGKGKVQKPVGSTQESFKRWLAKQAKMNEDEDAGQTAADFNSGDTLGNSNLSSMKPEDFPAEPEIKGEDEDDITQTQGSKAEESTASRLNAIKKQREARRQQESVQKPSVLDEEFDFKKLMKGDYNTRISE